MTWYDRQSKSNAKVMMCLSRYDRSFKPSHPINTTLSFDQNVRGCLLCSLEHYHFEQNTAPALKNSCHSVVVIYDDIIRSHEHPMTGHSSYLILWYDFLWVLIKTSVVAYFASWNTTTLNKIPRQHSQSPVNTLPIVQASTQCVIL